MVSLVIRLIGSEVSDHYQPPPISEQPNLNGDLQNACLYGIF